MAASPLSVYVDNNNYIYAYQWGEFYLILENELQYIHGDETGNEFDSAIGEDDIVNCQNFNSSNPTYPIHKLTEEEYNQIQAGIFPYGIPPVTSRDSSPVQPLLTYSVNWGTGNTFQKLSGKTYISPSGQRVDCSTLTVTFSSSQHFKKFYATAVKSGNDYGFINDVLVDIRKTNPTGILLYELTERDANVNFSFTINTSSLTSGNGEYRIGLYIQNDNGIWNYEYFLLEANNLQLEESNNLLLQVPVQTLDEDTPEEESDCGFVVNGNTLTITDSSKLKDGIINSNDYLLVGCVFDISQEEVYDFFQSVTDSVGNSSINFKRLNEICNNGVVDQQGNEISFDIEDIPLAICLTDGNNYYYIPLNENLFDNIMWGEILAEGVFHYFPIIHKNYILGINNILNNIGLYGIGYNCDSQDPYGDIMYLNNLGDITDSLFFDTMWLNNFETRVINEVYPISPDVNFEYPPLE